jgi:DNA-directed RNA polymerase subunit N (RpoN/RPB10)
MDKSTKEYHKNYYAENKAKILGSMKKPVRCEKCGASVSKCHMTRHQATKKCKEHGKEKSDIEIMREELKALEERLTKKK